MFPVWDVIFGTYHMPEDNRDIKFGVTDKDKTKLDTVFNLYVTPFIDAARLFSKDKSQSVESATEGPAHSPKQN